MHSITSSILKELEHLYTGKVSKVLFCNNVVNNQLLFVDNFDFGDRNLVYPGSFNPLHKGHVRLAEAALGKIVIEKQTTYPHIIFEIAALNADKPPIDKHEIVKRLLQFDFEQNADLKHSGIHALGVCITSQPLFVTKAELFAKCSFVIGADTFSRLIDVKYYPSLTPNDKVDNLSNMIDALKRIKSNNCKFVVGGRVKEVRDRNNDELVSRFETANMVLSASPFYETLKENFSDLFLELSEEDFRDDISSTSIRNAHKRCIMMNKTIAKLDGDKVYEGLRIPPTLDTLATVTFVLTQEPGKLKPKDLKIAIERNRAEREMRAEEQRKIREQGGGAGMLDLRGILAEEKLNSSQGDPFKRQLREMGFLADVDEVEKQEIEKEFRISEDYLGSNILSHDEINIVYKQRAIAQLHKKRTEWRVIQARQHTTNFAPIHQHVKAGASAPISRQILKEVNPLFDSNRNDVWGKRMNTLRRFISLVSKWLIRKRVTERMNKVTQTFADNGAFTREEVLAFIKKENELALKQNNGGGGNSNSNNINGHDKKSVDFNLSHELAQDTGLPKRPNSVAEMVFQAPNEILTTRLHNEKVIKEMKNAIPITPELARRVLFPVCTMDNNNSKGSRKEMKPTSLTNLIQFDDRAFYQLKVRPNYITMNYKPHTIPPVPLYFPPCEEKSLRTGAPEELALRPPADEAKEDSPEEKEILTQFLINTPPEPVYMAALRILPPPIIPELSSDQQTEEIILAHRESLKIPKYLQPPSNSSGHISSSATTTSSLSNINLQNKVLSSQWTASDINFFTALPSMRLYNPLPRRCELDADWTLRPDNNKDKLEYQPDPSLRTKLCSKPGFLSANVYLLANHESRNKDTPPPPGPTLSDYYCPDQDRHISGFIHYQHDHLRGIVEKDPDISGLQSKQDKADYLTDSESDNDDNDIEYQKKNKPTMEKVRKLLHPPKKVEPVAVAPVDPKAKGGKGAADKKGAPPPVAAPVTPAPTVEDTGAGDTSIILGEGEKKEEQVELLRDRKILDYESTVLRTRQKKHDVIASRMVELSKQSRCILQQLPVQMPFHSYEDEVYKIIESQIPPLPTSHVESNHLRLSLNDSLPNLSATLMSSPNK